MPKRHFHATDVKRETERLADWVASPAGQAAIEEALKRSRAIRDELSEAHRIDPKDLLVRFTI